MNNFKNLWISKLCFWVFLLLIGPLSSTAMAANVLVVKNSSLPLPGDALIADLRNLGHIVTDATSLPAGALELSFDTIWYVNVNQPPGPAQRTQLAAFLAAGKGLHLTGGDTVQDPNNAIIESFINTDLNDSNSNNNNSNTLFEINMSMRELNTKEIKEVAGGDGDGGGHAGKGGGGG